MPTRPLPRPPHRRARRATLVAALLTLSIASLARIGPASPATSTSALSRKALYLPRVERDVGSWPDAALAERIWDALAAFERAHPLAALVPSATVTPSVAAATANVEAACADFPDIPDVFGPGAHRAACRVWVPDAYGLYYAADALHRVRGGAPLTDTAVVWSHAWALAYLAEAVRGMELFVFLRRSEGGGFGRDDTAPPIGFRDTRAAIWQNPQRALQMGVLAEMTGRTGPLPPDLADKVDDVLVSTARAWRSAFWSTGRLPNARMDFRTNTAQDAPALSLHGERVAATSAITIHWDADKRNSPAEEMAWMGGGVVVAMAVSGDRISVTERAALTAAGRHYLDFALSFQRPDPLLGGVVRTVGAEAAGGPYGQNPYWIENHQDDAPSLPYLGYTWVSLGLALLTSDEPDLRPWPTFAPPDAWPTLVRSAEATYLAPDGRPLTDLASGGVGFDVARFPLWTMPCGEHRAGALYVDVGPGRRPGAPRYVSEIGHPAGPSVLLAGVPLVGTAVAVGDLGTARRWQARVDEVLAAYTASPPGFEGVACKVAPWVSASPAYHWAYVMEGLVANWRTAIGLPIGPRAVGAPHD